MNDLTSIIGASPAVALMFVLNGIGMALKAIPQVNNKLIPLILMALGGTGFGFVGNIGAATRTPVPLLVIYGMGIALAAVGLVESKRTLLEPDLPKQLPGGPPAVPPPGGWPKPEPPSSTSVPQPQPTAKP